MTSGGSRAARRDSLDQVGRDWSSLAAEDPLWAICVDPARRGGRWDVAEFMASGRAEAGQVLARLDELGICPARDAALDFGCGVGRLTAALADHFGSVTGVDIAAPMLDRARSLLGGRPGVEFVQNTRPDLSAFASASFDLAYSSLVLQHLPPDLAAGYLRELVRVVRPGGAVVIVVPEAHRRTLRGRVYAYAPQALIGLIQRRAFGYPAAMRMHTLPARRVSQIAEPAGGHLVASDPVSGVGDHWHMARHFIAR
jgi:SAM-dependent methyltransferase